MMSDSAPFTCTHSPNLPHLLYTLNCSIAISTYQAGKVILISAKDPNHLIQLPRTFKKPMGIAVRGERMAIATQTEVITFRNARKMAPFYPKSARTYDALYLPRASFFTGELDIHDLHWTSDALWAVNTRFSCLSKIDDNYSFTPQWKPFFIKDFTPDDQCHLNGVAFENDLPVYVTALGMSDTGRGWRSTKATGGILIDVQKNEIAFSGLQMPHSPRIYDGNLYVLESASGNLVHIKPFTNERDIVAGLTGFVRGMDRIGDYAFIGLSKMRQTSSFNDLPIAQKSVFCGVAVVNLKKGEVEAWLKYENSVEEIYEVRVLEGMRRPNVLNHYQPENLLPLTSPHGDYWPQPKDETENDKNTNRANP